MALTVGVAAIASKQQVSRSAPCADTRRRGQYFQLRRTSNRRHYPQLRRTKTYLLPIAGLTCPSVAVKGALAGPVSWESLVGVCYSPGKVLVITLVIIIHVPHEGQQQPGQQSLPRRVPKRFLQSTI